MKFNRMIVICMVLCLLFIPTTVFAGNVPTDQVELDSLWIREDVVVSVTEGIMYSDDGMKRALYEETQTEVYRVNTLTGQRVYYHTRYDIIWTGQFRSMNSSSGVWITDSDYVDVHYSNIERSAIIQLMMDTMDFLG